jgi:hypothetical protein
MKNEKSPIKLFIATPCYGGNLHHQYVISLLQLTQYLNQTDVGYTLSFLGNESLVTRARNIMVGKFLSDASATHLLFIDADIQFSADGIAKLLAADKDVCVGVYPAKSFHFNEIKEVVDSVEDPSDLKSLCLNYMLAYDYDADHNLVIDEKKRLIRLKSATTGFMLIKRNVFEEMIKFYPQLQYSDEKSCCVHRIERDKLYLFFDCIKDPETNEYLSEDYAFSYLWRQMGGEIWADMDSRLSHWGNYRFEGNLWAYFTTRRHVAQGSRHRG